ncbi:MAG: LytTR family DNA-binding domain-containing protein [Bacteroidota bacterium]
MKKLRCIAIDDEPLALEVLQRFAAKVPGITLEAVFQNPVKASQFLQEEKVDLIFLDIQMPDLTGMQFLETLSEKPLVIFTTAYSQYAVDSYNLDAVDYLLKPIVFDRFVKAVNKAQEVWQAKNAQRDIPGRGESLVNGEEYLFIKSDTRFFKVNYGDILFIEGMRDYIAVHTPKQRILTLMSMTKMLERLPSADFMRVHKSYIIGIHHINLIQNNRVIIAGKEIPISNSYKEAFLKFVENR